MGKGSDTPWEKVMIHRALKRWALSAKKAHTAKNNIRLANSDPGSSGFPKPHNADWAWRPRSWRGNLHETVMHCVTNSSSFGDEVTLFHDCSQSEITVRQIQNSHHADQARFGLQLDVPSFDGSFLSVVLDMPADAVTGLKRSHILQVNSMLELVKHLKVFARLNIRHGPNTEQIVCELPLDKEQTSAEFDLAYVNLNEKRIDKIWIDLIFERPEMNQIIVRDLTFSRRPRAQL